MEEVRIKCAGGSIAQLLALAASIKISRLIRRDFVLDYFPGSTGTYWPFAIKSLLKSNEYDGAKNLEFAEMARANDWDVGKPIPNSDVFKSGLSYENFLEFLRSTKLDRPIRRFRGEYVVGADYQRLLSTPVGIRAVTGGYPPFVDEDVLASLENRFKTSDLVSPFSKENSLNHSYGVIHYRLGDQRATAGVQKPGLGLPLHPRVFAEIVKQNLDKGTHLYVCSDEPSLAKHLLESQDIEIEVLPKKFTNQGIWSELQFMSQADFFIGSWSQVSQFASILVSHRGGKVWYPNSPAEGGNPKWAIPGVNMFRPEFLAKTDEFFKSNYAFSENTHLGYGTNNAKS